MGEGNINKYIFWEFGGIFKFCFGFRWLFRMLLVVFGSGFGFRFWEEGLCLSSFRLFNFRYSLECIIRSGWRC